MEKPRGTRLFARETRRLLLDKPVGLAHNLVLSGVSASHLLTTRPPNRKAVTPRDTVPRITADTGRYIRIYVGKRCPR